MDFKLKYLKEFLTFMIMGAGANWVLATAVFQEIPYLENNAPEGLCIATYLNASNNFGFVSMMIYIFIQKYVYIIPYELSIPFLLALSSFGCFYLAVLYKITLGGFSIMLYVGSAIGGSVGALSSVIFNPFMTRYENDNISASKSGADTFIVMCAIIGLIQNPGSKNIRFSPGIYFTIFGFLLLLPLFSYYHITKKGIGLRVPQTNGTSLINDTVISNTERTIDSLTNKTATINVLVNPIQEENDEVTSVSSPISSVYSDTEIFSILVGTSTSKKGHTMMNNFTCLIISNDLAKIKPWLRATVPYMLTVGWINFHTWGMTSALYPFAIANSSEGSGSYNLSIAYELGAIALVFGDLSTTIFKLPIFPSLIVFSILSFTIYLAALNLTIFHSASAGPLLILVFTLQRFIEAHLIVSTYRTVASKFPKQYREEASRAVGLTDQTLTTTGAILSTIVVTLLFSCTADA